MERIDTQSLRVRPARTPHCAWLVTLALVAALLAVPVGAGAQTFTKFAGTYRIESWRALQKRKIYQFFYLAPDGQFLLAADWPGKERSQFVGTWSVDKGVVTLRGQGHVHTNEGSWNTPFHRNYRIEMEGGGFVLSPAPVKNHYGMMGWPQYYRYYRRQPAPNLPGVPLPATEPAMAKHIAQLLSQVKQIH